MGRRRSGPRAKPRPLSRPPFSEAPVPGPCPPTAPPVWPPDARAHRHRRLGAAGQRRGAHAVAHHRRDARHGPRGGDRLARPVQDAADADLSRDPAGDERLRTHAGALQGVRAGGHPHRHGRPGGPGRAAPVPGVGAAVHHQLPHALPRVPGRALPAALHRDLPLLPLVPPPVGTDHGGHADHARGAGASRLPQHLALDAGGGHRAVPPPPRRRARPLRRPAAPGVPQRRPRGGGEEHRGVPGARPAGLQGGGGRRAAAGGAGGALPPPSVSPARGSARTWRPISRAPTCSSSPR